MEKNKKIIYAIFVSIVLIVVLICIYFYIHNANEKKLNEKFDNYEFEIAIPEAQTNEKGVTNEIEVSGNNSENETEIN